ncbi:MAG: betaine/proline/choline family ABC transporter ATP-binding protein [Deltaproteobacteria bacterium]|nr:betaine/proline/choline family ABC transporter ATP-binding protein [Deltaproteobacteria bacterium]
MIRLEKVTKIYPDGTEAVREVSFEVDRGKLCVLLGPSGCGKTTTMKMINRLIFPTSGRIYIDGTDNTSIDENELRRNIGYAIQEIGLFPHMTIGENIATVPALKGWPKAKRRKRAKELLELLRLTPDGFIDKYPRELSGGQRQRVGVARAFGGDPPILLMDEPFGAIDPITRVDLQNEFLKIQEELQKTIIFVTHDIHEAIKMGDKIALMKAGRLVQYAPPAELLYGPKDEFVADFVGADRGLKGLQLIRTKEVMWRSPRTAKPDEEVKAVRDRMEREGIDWLAVIDNEGRFTGWVVSSDLERGQKVREIMSTSAISATRNAVLSEALSLMLTSGLNVLAIVDQHDRLEGVLTFQAIQEALREAARKASVRLGRTALQREASQ